MQEKRIGTVSHYFGHIDVAAVDIMDDELHLGDTIHVKGHTSDFTVTIDSMQIDKHSVEVAKKGDSVGIHVPEHAREHDDVFKIVAA